MVLDFNLKRSCRDDNSFFLRLVLMMLLQYMLWGAFLPSLGALLASLGQGGRIGWYFAAQGVVALFVPALTGMLADRYDARRIYGLCHLLFSIFLALTGFAVTSGHGSFSLMFPLYCAAMVFFMPTISLSNSICYSVMARAGADAVKTFPKIRIFGTIGFVAAMWLINFLGLKLSGGQMLLAAGLGLVLAIYSQTLPSCRRTGAPRQPFAAGASVLIRKKELKVFFIFAILTGVCQRLSDGYASAFLESFGADASMRGLFLVKNSMLLLSLSQISEALCILLIPLSIKHLGIRKTLLISMLAWFFRFGLLGLGNPADRAWMLVASMLVYGVAFTFFSIAGSIYVEKCSDEGSRAAGQGLLQMMTNGFGSILGMTVSQKVLNGLTETVFSDGTFYKTGDWTSFWCIFAVYVLVVACVFALASAWMKENDGTRTQG